MLPWKQDQVALLEVVMSNSQTLICPHCRRETPYGATVCQGCQAEIVYSATTREELGYGCLGGMVGFIGSCVLSVPLGFLFSLLSRGIGSGSEIYTSGINLVLNVLAFLGLGIGGVILGIRYIRTNRRKQGPRFIRTYTNS